MADHAHDHSHTHDHDHEGGDSYFIDQLCMVGLSGAFGAICLTLWFWQRNMLNLMLGAQFHYYVLASGFVLAALALMRGAILWNQSKDPAFAAGHGHDHDHSHDHAHAIQEKPAHLMSVQTLPLHVHDASCGHEHKPGEACDHGHEHHAHAHGHHHHHDHDEADHDHGWAPWRYVVILVPIILFLLGLPNKPPSVIADQNRSAVALAPEAETHVFSIGLGPDPLAQLAHLNAAVNGEISAGKGIYVDYKKLESLADAEYSRKDWIGKTVDVRGQYAPSNGTSQLFMLVRLKIACCANDAVQLNVPMISREPIRDFKINDWVKVTGRVDFRKDANGSYKTVVVISKASDVEPCAPDPYPYVQ
jgi:hypothetical protein